MFAKKILLLAAAGMLSVSAFAKAAPHHGRPPQEKKEVRIPLSEETKRLAAECRRDPSDEKREALKRQVRRDYDRYVSELRNKPKSNKHRRDQHRRNEELIRDRDRRVDEIVERLLDPPPPPGENNRKPKPPRRKR